MRLPHDSTDPTRHSGSGSRVHPADPHHHDFDHETGDGPDATGRIVITERCACGEPLRTYVDWVA